MEGRPLIGCFGNLNGSKRVLQVLEAFARLRANHPEARLLLVGAEAPDFDAAGRMREVDLAGVERAGYVDEQRLWSLMAACDVLVSLRAPTMGETSGSVIRGLVLGKPLVVSDVGWFAELPDEVALKVPVDAHEVEVLAAALDRLASSDDERAGMGSAALEYVRVEHDLERVADAYVGALEEAAGAEAVRETILGELARAAAEVGIGPEDQEAGELARRANEVRLWG